MYVRWFKVRNLSSVLEGVRKVVEREENVVLAVVFGGILTGTFRDVDVAVYLSKVPTPLFIWISDVASRIEREIGYPVDLRVLNDAPASVRAKVLSSGIVVFERFKGFAEELLISALKEMFDARLKLSIV